MGYPYIFILLGAYIRWIFSGFKRKKLERYLDEDQEKMNFIVFILFTIAFDFNDKFIYKNSLSISPGSERNITKPPRNYSCFDL